MKVWKKGWRVERKGYPAHKEVPQWMPRCEAVNSIATDHKGTTEPGDSDQTAGHTRKNQPVQPSLTKNTEAQNIQTESLSSLL